MKTYIKVKYCEDLEKEIVRREIHSRMAFAHERGEHYYKAMKHVLSGGNIFSSRSTHKFLQARRIYIHYQNEFQRKQKLPLSI